MKGILCVSLLVLLMPSVACAAALPGDSADGKRLHDANCMGCHDTGKEFSASETQNIIKYLNDQFYHFR